MKKVLLVISLCLFTTHGRKLLDDISSEWKTLDGLPPLLFGHGGDKFYLPEHTTGSYKISAIGGADYIEPDVVLTKDKIPVCYHDLALKRSSDVADHPEFANLRGNHSVIIDGKNQTMFDDWLIIDFTLEQLMTLRVKQDANGVRMQDFNGFYPIATFQQFLDTIHETSMKLGRPIGLIPELKHPQFHNTVFNEVEHFMETLVLGVLRSNGYPLIMGDQANCTFLGEAITCGPIIFQNFDENTVQYLSTVTSHPSVELMTLIHPNVYLLTPTRFQQVANFSDYICLWKEYMYTGVDAEISFRGWEYDPEVVELLGGFFKPNEFLPEAHRLGVKMALFTIPDSRENSGRGCAIACDPTDKEEEMFYFFELGVDGMFVENVPETVAIRMKYDYELKLANFTRNFEF